MRSGFLPSRLFESHKSKKESKPAARDGGDRQGGAPDSAQARRGSFDRRLWPCSRIRMSLLESPSLSEFRALVVRKADVNEILRDVGPGSAAGKDRLPVRLVKLPIKDVSKVAVLSWRWDADLKSQGSRNVASAVYQAKKMGIRYLFIDAISIDQSLPGDALLKQVVVFSALYRTIPVIAAYDKVGEDFERTIYRPWIVNEMRLFRYNPTKIVYVGHSNQGTKHQGSFPSMSDPKGEEPELCYKFREKLVHVWTGSFIETIIGVLCNAIGMCCISDFKFIIPPYAPVLSTAYENMSRNDYLITAAILFGVHGGSQDEIRWDVAAVKYDRYSFRLLNDIKEFSGSRTTYGIFLDGITVGFWIEKYNRRWGYEWYLFNPLLDIERTVFTALALTDSDYREFAAQEEKRRACLVLETNTVPVPKVKLVSVKL